MINLLPPDYKTEIRAGRVNVILFRYLTIIGIAIAVVGVLVGGAYAVLTISRANAQRTQQENQQNTAQYQDTEAAIAEYKANLAVAKTILDKEVAYSDLVLAIAETIPRNVILEQLTLDETTLDQPTTLNFRAKNEGDVLKLKTSLQKHPELYEDVKIDSVGLGNSSDEGEQSSGGNSNYPVTATLSLVIKGPKEKAL